MPSGPQALGDAQLLRRVLGSGREADRLLAATGGLRGLFEQADAGHLPGLGAIRRDRLLAALEIARRYFRSHLERPEGIAGPRGAQDFLIAQFKGLPREVFACLFLDTRHRLLAFETLFLGTLDSTTVHPREVVRRALELGAAAVLLAHNHPSGVAEPSNADRALTVRLREALGLVDIRVLDHIVTADGSAVSFADRGWL